MYAFQLSDTVEVAYTIFILKVFLSTPRVGLISPPPYVGSCSLIEDLDVHV